MFWFIAKVLEQYTYGNLGSILHKTVWVLWLLLNAL